MTVIYALCEPDDSRAVRYIGKANDPEKRLSAHMTDSRSATQGHTRKARWLRSLSVRPVVIVLEPLADGADWQAAERRWIALCRAAGADLCNHTDGGEGLSGASEETRARLSASRIALLQDPTARSRLQLALANPARRAAISAALTGKKKTPEHVAKLPQNQLGRTSSVERRAAISRSLIGNKRAVGNVQSEASRIASSIRSRGNKHTLGRIMPDHEKIARSVANKGRAKTPEHREKLRQAAIRRWERQRETAA